MAKLPIPHQYTSLYRNSNNFIYNYKHAVINKSYFTEVIVMIYYFFTFFHQRSYNRHLRPTTTYLWTRKYIK